MHEFNDADATYKSKAEDNGDHGIKAVQPSQSGTIRLYGGAFQSPRHLGHVIMHELAHAYSRYNGFFLKNYKRGWGWDKTIALDEVFAYTWGSFVLENLYLLVLGL